jgi:CRISPR-associated endonuclease Cas1
MAATQNVYQLWQSRNSIESLTPRRGVVTLFGYGINVCVDRGHLIFEDGIGGERRTGRLARVRHGLRRLVVIGSDGVISLAALRWLADQDAAFVMLERDGSVLATTGPIRPSDAKMRRAQALAHHSGVAIDIARELIDRKLEAQEKLVRNDLCIVSAADAIGQARFKVRIAGKMDTIRLFESRAAHAYWGAWKNLQINFPKNELHRIPDHWKTFKNRVSPLTGSPRLATDPVNAMLNYLYALLESETRLAIAALGLDPGLGILHVDSQSRDSLACDVMEPIRPQVDAYVLNWISRETLKREWFFEERDGSCRLMGTFAVRLAETLRTWGSGVAPVAEWVSRAVWSTIPKPRRGDRPATRLTQSSRRDAKGGPPILPLDSPARPQSFCRTCGAIIGRGSTLCAPCSNKTNTAGLTKAAELGRVVSHSNHAETQRAASQRRHAAANASWQASELPTWLTKDFYICDIQPKLKGITLSTLASKLGISIMYAIQIRSRRRVPHPRHWESLARLVGVFIQDVIG